MYEPLIDSGVQMTTRDGVTLTGDLYRPVEHGRWPVLLHRTPYNRTDPFRVSGIVADPLWLARQGFAVLVQDVRGRFASGGDFDFITQEYNDSYDVIDWVAEQPWSDGNVGIYGSSYLGMTVLQAVASQNPHLKAAVAMIGTVDMRHTSRPGGVFELGFLTTYGLGLALAGLDHSSLSSEDRKHALKVLTQALADRHNTVAELPLTDIAPLDDSRLAPFWTDWLRSPHDPFWDKPSLLTEPERVTIPFLQVTGYRDFCAPTQFQLAERLSDNENAQMIAGPWTHMSTYVAFGQVGSRVLPNAAAGVPIWGQVLGAYFDRHLRGGDGSAFPIAAPYLSGTNQVTYFVGGSNTWAHAPSWPPAPATDEWHLTSGGDARSATGDGELTHRSSNGTGAASDTFTADPRAPFPTHGGPAMFEAGGGAPLPEGIQDQRVVDCRDDVLVYTSAPLTADVTIAGQPELVAFLTSSAPDADVCVTLVDVEPDGFAMNVSEGAQRARYRNDSDDAWLSPDEPSCVTVTLHDVAHQFRRGHRIRVQVAGFNFPRYSRNLHTRTVPEFGTLDEAVTARHTLHHAAKTPSVLRLPVLDQ
ncbi:CocE/NonD family hydrolase [Streptomyces malaysiensis]|uniref:CocE/NonD family hydrolase n=1 Tax=Streptomyces malaysiensis subsp. samsunensis TaxID=459658 RepID=A0A9X2M9F0_STRMQ|nr:CocE/NonD family hydrolase [Streptomyces samsunensis]MCQ8835474.1 CocE/NonD family hydrolase [Streptomyces samsunensis]